MGKRKEIYLCEDERLDQYHQSLSFIIQKPKGFRFNTDSVLVAQLVKLKSGDRICDFGTGTGIIPVILARRQKDCRIIALEVQRRIAQMAQRTMFLNQLQNRVSVLHGDVLEATSLLGFHSCDLIITNPPYRTFGMGKINLSQEKILARHAPEGSLAGWIKNAALCLKNKGRLAIIMPTERMAEVMGLFKSQGLEPKRLITIQTKVEERPHLFFLEGIKGANSGLIVESPLVIYTAAGEYTPELLNIYQGRGRLYV